MKKFLPVLLCVIFCSCTVAGNDVLVETEFFEERGGWFLDQQFYEQMGSAYLLAHGNGVPVEDAVTNVSFDEPGTYHVWVRTFNWVAPWDSTSLAPGRFKLLVNGKAVGGELGVAPSAWGWVKAGKVRIGSSRTAEVRLHDLTGFDGRCDAVFFTAAGTPAFPDRSKVVVTRCDDTVYDLAVVGAGTAGISAAVGAARLGLKVLLIDDKPTIGGNNSPEVRVTASGLVCTGRYPAIGRVIREYGNVFKNYDDVIRKLGEEGVELRTLTRVVDVVKDGDAISSLTAIDYGAAEVVSYRARYFADCTGDGSVGYMAGASFFVGQEVRSVYGETLAPEEPELRSYGSSVKWAAVKDGSAAPFPECPWAVQFTDSTAQKVLFNPWDWECGFHKDQMADAEWMRDYMFRVIYGNWAFLKNSPTTASDYADYSFEFVTPFLAKRESRRLVGDYVINQNDIYGGWKNCPDAAVWCTYPIDQHFPKPSNHAVWGELSFISSMKHNFNPIGVPRRMLKPGIDFNEPYMIPYRCFYSKDLSNMFMAGRDISGSRLALCSYRVQGSTAMMGEVVALACAICAKYGCSPRQVYTDHLAELIASFKKGVPERHEKIFSPD